MSSAGQQTPEAPEETLRRMERLVARMEELVSSREATRERLQARIQSYETMLVEAMRELERTRESFRSRQLRDLRMHIARVLHDNGCETGVCM